MEGDFVMVEWGFGSGDWTGETILQDLIDSGASVCGEDSLDRERTSPLVAACSVGNWALVRVLVENIRQKHGQAELETRAHDPHTTEAISPLAAAVCFLNNRDTSAMGALLELFRVPVDNQCTGRGETLLMLASHRRCDRIVAELCRNGANVDKTDDNGFSAVDHAIGATSRTNIFRSKFASATNKTLCALLDAKAGLTGQNVPYLISATLLCQLDSVKTLIAHKAEIDAQDAEGCTALMIAARRRMPHFELVLRQHGADTKDSELSS